MSSQQVNYPLAALSVYSSKEYDNLAPMRKITLLLNIMRVSRWIFQTNHWIVGPSKTFRSEHKILQKGYESLDEMIDGLAEIAVLRFGVEVVDSPFVPYLMDSYHNIKINLGLNPFEEAYVSLLSVGQYAEFIVNGGVKVPLSLVDEMTKIANSVDKISYLMENQR